MGPLGPGGTIEWVSIWAREMGEGGEAVGGVGQLWEAVSGDPRA